MKHKNRKFYLNETSSPALIRDPVDNDSLFVVMPMKAQFNKLFN